MTAVDLNYLLNGEQTNEGSILGQEFSRACMKIDLARGSQLQDIFLKLDKENAKQFYGFMFQVVSYLFQENRNE